MTEFAIVLPLFCLLLFGVVQFGIVWNNYVTLTDATRAAARKAAVSRHTDPVSEGCAQLWATASDLRSPPPTCDIDVDGPLDRPGADVTVRATYPYEVDLLWFVLASGDLETETTERME